MGAHRICQSATEVLASACLAAAMSHCTSSQPAGAPSAATPTFTSTYVQTQIPTDTQTATDPGTSTSTTGISVNLSPSCDPSQDFYTLSYPQNVEDCLSQGLLFNFQTNQCTTMFRASFTCTYAQLAAEMTNLGLDPSALATPQAQGLKLITCGTSNDGFTLVAQFYHPPAAPSGSTTACPFAGPASVSAQCYRKFVAETPPTAPGDQPGTAAYLNNCLQANPQ